MSSSEKDEPLLSRWSRRKRGIADEPIAETEEVLTDEPDEETLALREANREAAEAIDLDTISEESDLSMFFEDGVPAALRKQALAALWRSNPVFANVDGLVDYDDDFGSPDLIMKTFKSAYQVGQGYMQKLEELAETSETEGPEPAEAAGMREPEEVTEPSDKPETELEPNDTLAEVDEPVMEDPEAGVEVEEEKPLPRVSLRKRMTFDTPS